MTNVIGLACHITGSVLVDSSISILQRMARERSGLEIVRTTPSNARVTLDIVPGIGTEGFRIENGDGGGVRIIGNDERGLLYGVGKFLRTSRFGDGEFCPSVWRGTSVPEKPVRGIYFASHFHNFFHDAPIAKIERYLEELALWGCNALNVWFDMHHYTGIEDPQAQEMLARLRAILHAANRVGMGAGIGGLANEAYANSPEELRAVPVTWTGHYRVELCPHRPGATELLLKWRREMLEAFTDINVAFFWIWPYDQGGCLCEMCAPWGGNGFLKIAEPVARLARSYFPQVKIVLSTWCFGYRNEIEWPTFAKPISRKPAWIDYLMIDSHENFPRFVVENGVPGNYPVLSFPEISMWRMGPWGGWGANPLPRRSQQLWDQCRAIVSGGFPYSEGIYEDINKAIYLQFYWDSHRLASETVREYIAYEYSKDAIDAVHRAVEYLEANQGHSVARQAEDATIRCELPNIEIERAKEAFHLLQQADALLPAYSRKSWRWRILWLRAALDAELAATGGLVNEKCKTWFEELRDIYHAARAEPMVAPLCRGTS